MDDPASIFERVTSTSLLDVELSRGCFAMVRPLRHPLGFYAFMGPAYRGVTLRMHYWPPNAEVLQSGFEIHDHDYDIESRIVVGALEQTTFDSASREPWQYSVYKVGYSGSTSALQKTTERIGLLSNGIEVFEEGAHYKLASGILHRAKPILSDETVTLVLARGSAGNARVLGPMEGPESVSFQRESIDGEQVVALRSNVLSLLRRN